MSEIPEGRCGGCLPRESRFGEGAFPKYGMDGAVPVLPDPQGTYTLHDYHWWTPNQKHLSSCTTGMGINDLTTRREIEGKKRIKFAMAGLYAFGGITIRKDGDIDTYECHHRRADNGMALETMYLILQLQGVPPAEIDGVPYIDPLDWKGLREGRWPGDWREQANKYRMSDEIWDAPDSIAILSGLEFGCGGGRGADNHAVFQIDPDDVLGTWGEDYGHTGKGTVGGVHEWGGSLLTARGRRNADAGIRIYGGFCSRASRAEDAPPCEGIVPAIEGDSEEDHNRRRRRRRRFGRR